MPLTDLSNDPNYLLNRQYKDAGNLKARANLHARFSTNAYGWHLWVFDRLLALPADARIMELGSGPGWLWLENIDRIPAGWRILLSDFSPGMLAESRDNLRAQAARFAWQRINAESIPYPDEAFDGVIANHMLYHVPDRAQAISEVHRVLKPGGKFFCATNGNDHLKELKELGTLLAPDEVTANALHEHNNLSFTLENGAHELGAKFSGVTLERYEDALEVTEVEPLIAYALSGRFAGMLPPDRQETLRDHVTTRIAQDGAFRITKDAGLFIAEK